MAKQRPDIALVKQIAESFFNSIVTLEEVKAGVSTFVYRVRFGEQVYYLRILPEDDQTFAGEVRAHELLTRRGVKVPRVIHYEPCNNLVGRSLMIAGEVPGAAVQDSWPESGFERIMQEAGEQLALINQVPVEGFGWVKRERDGVLLGEQHSFADPYYEHLDQDLSRLSGYAFTTTEVASVGQLLETAFPLMSRTQAHLVHGDFDLTHIFHQHGCYSGIIDFGEIMGHSPLYDLGHFKLQDGVEGCPKGFQALLDGYREVTDLTQAELMEVDLWTLSIGVRRLGMLHNRRRNKYHAHFVEVVRQQLSALGLLLQ